MNTLFPRSTLLKLLAVHEAELWHALVVIETNVFALQARIIRSEQDQGLARALVRHGAQEVGVQRTARRRVTDAFRETTIWKQITQQEFFERTQGSTLDESRSGITRILFEGESGSSTARARITWIRGENEYVKEESLDSRGRVQETTHFSGDVLESISYEAASNKPLLARILAPHLNEEKNNQAYERSVYYVLNAMRRGGFIEEIGGRIVAVAKDYDKPNSQSVVFVSSPGMFSHEKFLALLRRERRKGDMFVHHLFRRTGDRLIRALSGSQFVDEESATRIQSYPPEDTYAQIIYPIHQFPQFNNSAFNKQRHLMSRLNNMGHNDFKKSVLEYLNSAKKDFNEPEVITAVIGEEPGDTLREVVEEIVEKIIDNWSANEQGEDFLHYQLASVKELVALLLDQQIAAGTTIVLRVHYDFELQKGGFWIAEINNRKSLMTLHVIITDHHYREQYTYLLYDLIEYAYLKSIDYINIGGSEEKGLFETKMQPSGLFRGGVEERPLFTIVISKQPNHL
jgi:hypothetical protein